MYRETYRELAAEFIAQVDGQRVRYMKELDAADIAEITDMNQDQGGHGKFTR